MPICNLCRHTVDPERDLKWVKDGLAVLRCPTCSLVFRAQPPAVEDLPEIYALDYFRDDVEGASARGYADYVRDEQLHRLNARRRLRTLEKYQPGRGRLLDVGCAAGFLVDEARRAGWEAKGVDVSEEMVALAVDNLHASVMEGTLDDVSIGDGELEAVTMWDYIEHAIDPAGDIERCARLLRPGGVLALSTGDVDSLVARACGRRWHLLTPRHHNFFFSKKTLRMLLERAGFEVLMVSYEAARYSLQHVVFKIETLVELPGVRHGARRIGEGKLGAVTLPLNLFDIVTVVARKA